MRILVAVLGFYAVMSTLILLLGWRVSVLRRRYAAQLVVLEAEKIAREVAG